MIECILFNGCKIFERRKCRGDGKIKLKDRAGSIQRTKCPIFEDTLYLKDEDKINPVYSGEQKYEMPYN